MNGRSTRSQMQESVRTGKKSSENGLKTGKKIWSDMTLGKAVGELADEEIDEAVSLIRDIPKLHGKGERYRAKTFRALIDKIDAMDADAMDRIERKMIAEGCTNQSAIRDARIEKMTPRLRVDTFMRNVRSANKVGKMLVGLGIIKENPFRHCTFSNREEKALKATEGKIARQKWDDRLFEFLATDVFQGKTEGEDDPLFWLPLIALLMGLRMEEAAQLGPDDVSSDQNIPYVMVRQQLGDSVKSEAGFRTVPVHPALIELGFMDLVQNARRCEQRRLFPTMTRGKTKGTYSENFTKTFGYYRKQHGVYWHGLDFHALRTTFHHNLQDNSCPGAIRRNLMGHEPLDEGERSYAQSGISMTTRYKHIAEIPLDVRRLETPIRKRRRKFMDHYKKAGLKLVAG